jgi:pilus assembly protein CpaE
MKIAIFSDDRAAAERLRSSLAECDVACPIDSVRSLASAASFAGGADALFLILSEDDSSLALLEELCSRGGTPVVAVGAARDPRFILRVVHAGPSDYLDIDADMTRDLRRALERVQPAEPARAVAGKLVSVLSHCGGSGCSLLAVNLSVAFAEAHGECLLCDFNVRRGDLATLLDLKPQLGVNDLLRHSAKLPRDVFQQTLTAHKSGVQLLAAPLSFADVRPIPVELMTQIINQGRRAYAYTVTDLEDFFHPEQFEVVRQSDTVLFVMRLDYTALRNARRTFDHLEHDGIEGSRFKLVANQHGRPRELTPAQAEEVLGRPLDHLIPYEPKAAIESINLGVPVIQSAPRSPMARALRKLSEEIAAPAPAAVAT